MIEPTLPIPAFRLTEYNKAHDSSTGHFAHKSGGSSESKSGPAGQKAPDHVTNLFGSSVHTVKGGDAESAHQGALRKLGAAGFSQSGDHVVGEIKAGGRVRTTSKYVNSGGTEITVERDRGPSESQHKLIVWTSKAGRSVDPGQVAPVVTPTVATKPIMPPAPPKPPVAQPDEKFRTSANPNINELETHLKSAKGTLLHGEWSEVARDQLSIGRSYSAKSPAGVEFIVGYSTGTSYQKNSTGKIRVSGSARHTAQSYISFFAPGGGREFSYIFSKTVSGESYADDRRTNKMHSDLKTFLSKKFGINAPIYVSTME